MTTISWLHQVIVKPTLDFMALHSDKPWIASENAQVLMLGIAAVESNLQHTRQIAELRADLKHVEGPARSYWQVEPATAIDVLSRRRRSMHAAIDPFLPPDGPIGSPQFQDAMRHSQSFGCCLARLKIMDASPAIPNWVEVGEQGQYWKLYYNSLHGAGHPDDYGHAFARHKIMNYAEEIFGGASV